MISMVLQVFQKSGLYSCTQYAADLIVSQLKLVNSVKYQISVCDEDYTPSGNLYHVDNTILFTMSSYFCSSDLFEYGRI